MKKAFYLIPLLALAACGNAVADAVEAVKEGTSSDFDNGAPITTTPANVEAFTNLSAMGPDNIVFKTGDRFSIVAQGDAEAVATLSYIVKDGRLAIGRKRDGWKLGKDGNVTITVTAPSLSAIALAGSGDLTADKLSGDEIKISLAGSGNLKVADISGKNLKSTLAGSGDFDIAGKVDAANFSIAGSGDMNAAKLVATDAKISIAGSGDASVNATGNVKASIAGSGNINVTGGATCSSSTVGSGKVHCS